MVYAVAARAFGAPPEISGGAFVLGAGLGAVPDALPWAVRLLTDRRDLEELLRDLLHRPAGKTRTWMQVLVTPWLHALADQYIHAPHLPDPGTSPRYDRVIIGRITVRDALWCAGELALWALVAMLVLLYRRI
jgi:hypothetical protein